MAGKKEKGSFWRSLSSKARMHMVLGLIALIVVLGAVLFVMTQMRHNQDGKFSVVTVSSLEKIIDVSELSTFTAIYNGITQVANEKKPEDVDYYVSYEAKINAGIDFDKIQFSIEEDSKTIGVTLPPVRIIDTSVNIATLDFIFYNDKMNEATVSQQAYKACIEDVAEESAKQEAIIKFAQENAMNVVRALIDPIVEQYDPEYQISVIWGADEG